MNRISIFILLATALCGKNLIAQTYQPILGTVNEWYIYGRGTALEETDLWKTTTDTVINSTKYTQIGAYSTLSPSLSRPLKGVIREDTSSRKVYYRNCYTDHCDASEIILYDFGKLQGEVVTVNEPYGAQSLKNLVLDTIITNASFSPDGIYYLYAVEDTNREHPFIWIEGLGSLAGFENNVTEALSLSNEQGSILLCAYRDSVRTFRLPSSYPLHLSNPDTCVINYVGMDDISLNSLNIFPNPARGAVNISFTGSNHSITRICLTDMHGRQMLQTAQTTFAIPGNINQGMYLIYIWFASGEFAVRKILIE